MKRSQGPLGARLRIVTAAVLFSTGGAAIKACSLSSWQVAGFRSAVAAVALWALVPSARRGWGIRPGLVAVAYATTLVLYVAGNKLTTAANTIFLQSTAPIYVLLLGPWLLKEKLRSSDLGFVGIVALGLACFFVGLEEPVATAPDPLTGNLLAVGAGVAWAFTIVGLRWMSLGTGGAEAAAAVTMGNLLAFLACAPWAFPVAAGPIDWLIVAYLGVVQIALAYALLTSGLRQILALEAALLILVEPVLNPGWAWLVLGEVPGAWALLGGALVIGATAVRIVRGTRESGVAGER